MMTIMPLMFGFFSLSFASGLSVYFIASNLIGIGQYALTGKINLPGRQADESEKSPKVVQKGDVIEAAPAKAKRDQVEPAPKVKLDEKPKRGAPVKAKRAGRVYDSRAERARAKSKAKG
jgi:membrane protein insertase Oxa1/YidC/SpoIIIJ